MTTTIIPFGDIKAQKRWANALSVDTLSKGYFTRKFEGVGENSIIQQKTELESDAGEQIIFDLSVQLRGKPVSGDTRVLGREENLRFFSDSVYIDQLRMPVSAGGKMTRKRTSHNLRQIAKDRLSDFWAEYMDQIKFIYAAGARGVNQDFYEDTTYTGFANNTVTAPDSAHIVYPGTVSSKATLTSGDTMSRNLIEKVGTTANMLRAVDTSNMNLVPVNIEGEPRFVLLMSPYQEYSLRIDTSSSGWLELQKAAAQAEGSKNKIFTGSLGMINNIILHTHKSVIRFSDYGAGNNVAAARAMFMGRQALVIAYGTPGGSRFTWVEDVVDYGNEPTVVAGCIFGVKKTRFNGKDFGIMAVDTAAAAP